MKGFNYRLQTEIGFAADPNVNLDVREVLANMALAYTESVATIYSLRNIENAFPHDVPLDMLKFHRALRSNSFILIACLDLPSAFELF